jgi:hypothetical protein
MQPVTPEQIRQLAGWDKVKAGQTIQVWDTNALMDACKDQTRFSQLKGAALVAVPPFAIVELGTVGSSPESDQKTLHKLEAAKFAVSSGEVVLPQVGKILRAMLGTNSRQDLLVDAAEFRWHLNALGNMTDRSTRDKDQDFQAFQVTRTREYAAWKSEVTTSNQNIRTDLAKTPVTALKKHLQKKFSDALAQPEVGWSIFTAMIEAVAGADSQRLIEEATEAGHIGDIVEATFPYLTTYMAYQQKIAGGRGGEPDENDRGDLELVKYLGFGPVVFPGTRWELISSEKKWLGLLGEVGLGSVIKRFQP